MKVLINNSIFLFRRFNFTCTSKNILSLKKYDKNQIIFPIPRLLSTNLNHENNVNNNVNDIKHKSPDIIIQPPYLIRLSLIGSSVGLGTPLFITGGVAQLWYSYLPKSDIGAILKYGVGIVIGGGFFKLSHSYIYPFLINHSEFILPFALTNAIVSTTIYGVLEKSIGLPLLIGDLSSDVVKNKINPTLYRYFVNNSFNFKSLPIGGALIGGLTAFSSPLLWPMAFKLCWGKEMTQLVIGNDSSWISDIYNLILFPVAIPVGILSGALMHNLLVNIVIGKKNIPWQKNSLPILFTLLALSFGYFSYCKTSPSEYLWEQRLDYKTDIFKSYNPLTKETVFDDGVKGIKANKLRSVSGYVLYLKDFIQDLWIQIYDYDNYKKLDVDYSLKSKPIDVLIMQSREKLYPIVDLLTRIKHLNLTSNFNSNYKIDITKCKNDLIQLYGIRNIDNYLQDLEIAVYLDRNINLLTDKISTNNLKEDIDKNLILKEIDDYKIKLNFYIDRMEKNIINDYFVIFSERKDYNSEVKKFLHSNLFVIDEEFRNNLSYIIGGNDKIENKKFVNKHNNRELVNNIINTGLITAIIGTSIYVTGIFFGLIK